MPLLSSDHSCIERFRPLRSAFAISQIMIALEHRSECRVIGSGQQLRLHAVSFLTVYMYLTFELQVLGNETAVLCGLHCVDLGTGNERQ